MIGGHCAFNPEPLADFVDFVVLGDGEEVVGEITEVVGGWIRGGRADRAPVLRDLAQIPGVYVPSLYDVVYDGPFLRAVTPLFPDVPAVVDKRTVADLAEWPYPKRQLVPLTEVVHDRLNVEVFRGCTRGCRFCQAGMITRPVRERPADQVRTMVAAGLARTGYDEVSLTSLSTADFSDIESVVGGVLADREATPLGCPTTVNLPSLRVDAFTVGLAGQVNSGRRSGLTFAPEAGSWRLRSVINKLITEDDLYGAVEAAYSAGWTRMKLYFMIGLPTEIDEDTLGIAELARNCVEIGRRFTGRASVTASVGGFVPKPHTPFQWFGQNTLAELHRKLELLAHPQAAPRPAEVARPGGERRRGHRQSRGSRASAGSSSGCGGPAEPSRSGASASTSAVGPRRCRPRDSTSTGTSSVIAPSMRCCRGSICAPGCTRTSSGPTGRRRSPAAGSRTAGGHRATTAGCAPGTASSMSWRPPCPRPVGARARGKTCPTSCGSESDDPSWRSPATQAVVAARSLALARSHDREGHQ